MTDRPISETG